LRDLLFEGYPNREQSKRTLGYNLRYSRDRVARVPVRSITFEHVRVWLSRLTVAPATQRNALTAAAKPST
jgi:hypothetical protein